MFPDDSDEDADTLDDDALLQAVLRPDQPATPKDVEASVPDWPSSNTTDTILRIDPATSDWFKSHHADWQREIRLVLRAWIASQMEHPSTTERAAGHHS